MPLNLFTGELLIGIGVGVTASNVVYDNSDGTLVAINVKTGLDELSLRTAVDLVYDNSDSNIRSTNAKEAFDELSWEELNVVFADSPVSVISMKQYHVDTTGGEVLMLLDDLTALNNGRHYKIYKTTGTNDCVITTVSGTDAVGNDTLQDLVSSDTGLTLQANFDKLKYEVTQDSRGSTPAQAVTLLLLDEASGVTT